MAVLNGLARINDKGNNSYLGTSAIFWMSMPDKQSTATRRPSSSSIGDSASALFSFSSQSYRQFKIGVTRKDRRARRFSGMPNPTRFSMGTLKAFSHTPFVFLDNHTVQVLNIIQDRTVSDGASWFVVNCCTAILTHLHVPRRHRIPQV